jgi:hypothetical protein
LNDRLKVPQISNLEKYTLAADGIVTPLWQEMRSFYIGPRHQEESRKLSLLVAFISTVSYRRTNTASMLKTDYSSFLVKT